MLGGALEAYSTQTCMVLWMKASGLFSVPQNNTYPLGITAIGTSPYKRSTALYSDTRKVLFSLLPLRSPSTPQRCMLPLASLPAGFSSWRVSS